MPISLEPLPGPLRLIDEQNGATPALVFCSGNNFAFGCALAEASKGSIRPGDLLTTSPLAGHCMKVTDHAKALGTIIRKAMRSLKEGTGMVLVLVLVTLQ